MTFTEGKGGNGMQKAIERVEIRYAAQAAIRRYPGILLLLTALLGAVTAGCAALLAAPAVAFIRSQPQDTQVMWLQILSSVLDFVLLIPVCGLSAGYIRAFIDLAQGRTVRTTALFGQLKRCMRGVWLYLWIAVHLALRVLGAAALIFAAAVLAGLFPVQIVENLLMTASVLGSVWLLLPALMQYALAFHVLSDEAELGAAACARRSRELMAGNRMHLLWLLGRYALVLVCVLLVTAAVLSLLLAGMVTEETLGAAFLIAAIPCTVYYGLQAMMALTCFYLKRRSAGAAPDAALTASEVSEETAHPAQWMSPEGLEEQRSLEEARPEAVSVMPDVKDGGFRVGGDE